MSKRTIRLADVAKAAGVSHGTASNVFSRPEIVRDEVRKRVLEAASKLGYAGPDPRGRMLRAGKVNAIGVVAVWHLSYFFDDPYARVVLTGISQECDRLGAGISLVSAANTEQLVWNIQSALVDGFILFCMDGGSRVVELARERGLPFVALDYDENDGTVPSIRVDDREGARMAARHLAELGHRRFAVLSLPIAERAAASVTQAEVLDAMYLGPRERIRGYFEVLADYGIDVDSIPIHAIGDEDFVAGDVSGIAQGLERMFASDTPPTAILSMSDRIAIIALEWMQGRGISVPGDVSIIGFDGVPEGENCEPALTTVSQPMIEEGRRAVQAIMSFDGTVRRETLPVELIVRGSTALPRAS